MNTYAITIYDDFFRKEFDCKIAADNEAKAIKEARNYYAYELDTDPFSIQVIKVRQVV